MIPHSLGRAGRSLGAEHMKQSNQHRAAECPVRCPHCAEAVQTGQQPIAAPQGWRLVRQSIWVFLLPLVLAIAGAAAGGEGPVGQLIGAVVGLAAGMAASWLTARLVRRTGKELG